MQSLLVFLFLNFKRGAEGMVGKDELYISTGIFILRRQNF